MGAGGFSGCFTLVSVGASEQAERRRIKPSGTKTFILFLLSDAAPGGVNFLPAVDMNHSQ
jgi:hypothetical protein